MRTGAARLEGMAAPGSSLVMQERGAKRCEDGRRGRTTDGWFFPRVKQTNAAAAGQYAAAQPPLVPLYSTWQNEFKRLRGAKAGSGEAACANSRDCLRSRREPPAGAQQVRPSYTLKGKTLVSFIALRSDVIRSDIQAVATKAFRIALPVVGTRHYRLGFDT